MQVNKYTLNLEMAVLKSLKDLDWDIQIYADAANVYSNNKRFLCRIAFIKSYCYNYSIVLVIVTNQLLGWIRSTARTTLYRSHNFYYSIFLYSFFLYYLLLIPIPHMIHDKNESPIIRITFISLYSYNCSFLLLLLC